MNIIYVLAIILCLVGLFFYALTAKKEYKKLILDCMNGTITYPDSLFGKLLKGLSKYRAPVTGDYKVVLVTCLALRIIENTHKSFLYYD